jgi:hypothetical protein
MTVTYNDATYTYDATDVTYDGVSPQFDGVTVTVQAAFGSQPLNTSPNWQDITPWVRRLRINRGRKSEFVLTATGTADIALDNRDRRFDPEYTSSPYYGDLNPMVPIRVEANYNGDTWTLFYGFAKGWPSVYEMPNVDAVSTITAVDGNRLLSNTVLNPAYEQVVVSDPNLAIYFPMQPEYWRDGGYLSPQKYGLWDYTNTVKSSFNLDGTGTFTEAAAPVQVNKSFRYDTTKNVAGTHLAGWDVISAGGYGSTGEPLGFNRALKTLEVWLESVDEERADIGSTGQAFVSAAFGDDSGGYLSFLEISPEADSTLYRIRYYTDTVGHDQTGISGAQLNAEAINHLVLTANDTNVLLYLNGSLVYNVAFNDTVDPYSFGSDFRNVVFGAYSNRFAHMSVYYDTFDAAKVADRYAAGFGYTGDSSSGRLSRTLDDAGWPSAWRDIETGVQTVGAYRSGGVSAQNYLEQIANAEQGEIFINRDGHVQMLSRTTTGTVNIKGLFDDNGTDAPFSDIDVDANSIDTIRNSIAVRYATDTVTVEDSGSVAAYGRAQQSLNAELIDNPDDATAIGETRLAATKNPRTRITMLRVNVRSDVATTVPTVAPLDLGDDVAVSFTPTNVGDPLWRAVTVQGIRHTITGESWETQLYLSPSAVNTNGALLVLDDDTYGKLDDGNKLG